jgi:hypothetical protein
MIGRCTLHGGVRHLKDRLRLYWSADHPCTLDYTGIGAQAFGWKAALVTRGVNAPLVLDGIPQPTLVVYDVGEAARAIAADEDHSSEGNARLGPGLGDGE